MALRGKLISLEGIEGSGKSTQARTIVSRLRERGVDVLVTREPGGTPAGEVIRGMLKHNFAGEALWPETEVLLFAASRAQLVRRVLLPALERGTVVVSDRFVDSTIAYQGYARGIDMDTVLTVNRLAAGNLIPDVTVLLDVEARIGLERVRDRNKKSGLPSDRIERENESFHERVRLGYLELAQRCPERMKVVDGGRECESVAGEVWEIVPSVVGRPVQ